MSKINHYEDQKRGKFECGQLQFYIRDLQRSACIVVRTMRFSDSLPDPMRLDAGVRLGEQVEKDMIAVRISPPIPMAIIGSPDYFSRIPKPHHPRDSRANKCLNLRTPTSCDFYDSRLSHCGKPIHVRSKGQLMFNALGPILDAALAGLGVANLPLDQVEEHLRAGRLVRVLADWSEDLPAYISIIRTGGILRRLSSSLWTHCVFVLECALANPEAPVRLGLGRKAVVNEW